MTKSLRMVGVMVLAGLIVSITMSGLGLQSLGMDSNVFEITADGHPGYTIAFVNGGVVELDESKYATACQPTESGLFSEKIVILDNAEVSIDGTDFSAGWLTDSYVWLVEYRFDWWVGSQKIEGVTHSWRDAYISDGFTKSGTLSNSDIKKVEENLGMTYGEDFYHTIMWSQGEATGDSSEILSIGFTKSPTESPFQLLDEDYPRDGFIKCELWVNIAHYTDDYTSIYGNYEAVVASYTSELADGSGRASLDVQLPPTEEGAQLDFYLDTGYSSGEGWECKINPPASLGVASIDFSEDGFTGQDDFGKWVDYEIPSGWFTLGGDNMGSIEVISGIYGLSEVVYFVVDNTSLIPGPVITGDPRGVIQSVTGGGYSGDTMTVMASATPNTISNSSIDYFVVFIYYGQPGSMPGSSFPDLFIKYNYRPLADTNGDVTFYFQLKSGVEGDYTIQVHAIDEAGRASAGSTWTGYASKLSPSTPVPTPVSFPFTFTLPVIVLSVIIAIGAMAILWYAPLPFQYKVIAVLLWCLALGIYAYRLGRGL